MTKKIEPQRCPFCRNLPSIRGPAPDTNWVICFRCYAAGPDRTTVNAAIKAWNRIQLEKVKP